MSLRTALAAPLMAAVTALLVWGIVDPADVKRFASGVYGLTKQAAR